MNEEQLQTLRSLIEENIDRPKEFVPGKTKVLLAIPSYGPEEILEVIDSLLHLKVTMGEKVARFERLFSEYVGTKNAVMVNSGSSANLIALSTLASRSIPKRIGPGDEVITPAVTWTTTVFSIANIGAVPVLVDVDSEDLTIDVKSVRKAITRRTRAILPVHLLGNPCDMRELQGIAEEHDLFLVEDACEAHGAEIDGKKIGSFGDLSSFSFFFSHHISTIEGGMIMTDNDRYADLARSLRAHGWIRERSDRQEIAARNPLCDERYLFVSMGYNLRPTEIQGAFGIHQIEKLEDFIRIRRENVDYWMRELQRYSDYLFFPKERVGVRHAFFGYPITVKEQAPFTRKELTSFLKQRGIETRPIMSGDITRQPAMADVPHRVMGPLINTSIIHSNSFFWGNHHGIGAAQREFIIDCVREFVEQKID